jgi:hypothetical protein
MGIGQKPTHLYGLPERGQTDISIATRVRCESLIPEAHPRPLLAGLKSTFEAYCR